MHFYKYRDKRTILPALSLKRVSLAVSPSVGSDDLRERSRVYKRVKLNHKALLDDINEFEEYLRTYLVSYSANFDLVEYQLHRR